MVRGSRTPFKCDLFEVSNHPHCNGTRVQATKLEGFKSRWMGETWQP